MADTLTNIAIPPGVWVDLYAQSGIPVGTLIEAQNVGNCDIYLTTRATQPPVDYDAYQIIRRSQILENEDGSSGEWAFCGNAQGLINIRVSA